MAAWQSGIVDCRQSRNTSCPAFNAVQPVSMQVRAKSPAIWCSRPDLSAVEAAEQQVLTAQHAWFQGAGPLRPAIVRQQLFFPDRRLLQYDCGKLQVLMLAA